MITGHLPMQDKKQRKDWDIARNMGASPKIADVSSFIPLPS
jgi:hypothetical protein